jgi:adenine-specific DNA methylase
MPGGNGGGPGIKSLEELIQRQRYGLNRTLNIERKALAGQIPDASSLDQLMTFETELAQNTRDTALGLEARGFDDTELFYQAESSMLQAVDSLSVGKWENATLQMRDALKSLIEQRDRALAFIMKNPDPAQLAALRAFDRLQAQKLRRPKTDKEEARELIRRLEALIGQEQSVVSGLDEGSAKPKDEEQPAGDAEEPKTETPADSEGTPAEPAAVEAPAA